MIPKPTPQQTRCPHLRWNQALNNSNLGGIPNRKRSVAPSLLSSSCSGLCRDRVAIIETIDIQQVLQSEVLWEHPRDEGEGYSSLAAWRTVHEQYRQGDEVRNFLMDPGFDVDDNTLVILERFQVAD